MLCENIQLSDTSPGTMLSLVKFYNKVKNKYLLFKITDQPTPYFFGKEFQFHYLACLPFLILIKVRRGKYCKL